MKKKTTKKLVLSKETLRGLTDDLRRVKGGEISILSCNYTCNYTCDGYASCPVSVCYVCEVPETTYPTCIA